MISDSERRDVAARMREIMHQYPHGFLDNMITQSVIDVMGAGKKIGETVADLIDRPACNDVGDDFVFRCSECGCELDINEAFDEHIMWKDGVATVPKYCPECGRMVKNGA